MSETKNTVTNWTTQVPKMGAGSVLMGLSGVIEASEREGQAELVESEMLPAENADRALCEAWGIVFGEPVKGDPLFVSATLPAGGTKRKTDHDMWSELLDERGHKRAAIFYKAAFYDRKAFMRANRRLYVGMEETETETLACVQTSDEFIVFKTDPVSLVEPEYAGNTTGSWQRRSAIRDSLRDIATVWLEDNYPDHKSAAAYWDLDVENGERPAPVVASEQANG